MDKPSQTEEEEEENVEILCLMRVGKNCGWLRLFENTEVTVGRGADVTYQLLSPSCPLMISRLHCTFKQGEDGQWTVTDKKSMNGVWVNNCRLVVEKAHQLTPGDSIQLGVALSGQLVEFDYILVRRPLKDVSDYLTKPHRDWAKAAHRFKKPKRKMTEETEPSTSSKRIRSSALASPPPTQEPQRESKAEDAAGNMDDLQMYSQNIMMLREQVDSTERRVASSLEGRPSQSAPFREEQVRELQNQLEMLRAKMDEMKSLEKSFNEAKMKPEVRRLLKWM